jgi:F-type H+-transporting ATPase subunit epsilon
VAAAKLKVSVISPERVVYEGPADMVVAPAWDGELGILRGHAPTLLLLGRGRLRVSDNGSERRFAVEGGFLQIENDVITVLSEQATET